MLGYPDPELADGVVRLRPWDVGDVACVHEASSDPGIVELTTVPERFTDAAARAFIDRQRARAEDGEGLSLAVAEADAGVARGLLRLGAPSEDGRVGVGYWIVPAERGRGLAQRSVRLGVDWVLGRPEVTGAEACVEPANAASQRVLRATGFEQTGTRSGVLGHGDGPVDVLVFAREAA